MKKLLFALIIASLWSFSEIFLRAETISIQYHSALLTSLAFGFLILFYSVFKNIKYILLITAVTLFIKWLSVPIQGIQFSCLGNSSLAIGLDGLIFSGMILIKKKKFKYNNLIFLGFSSALTVALFFRLIGLHIAPCPYFVSFSGIAGLFRFIYTEGITWAFSSALTVPVFYLAGTTISKKINNLYIKNQKIYYMSFSLAFILSFSSNIIALILGY